MCFEADSHPPIAAGRESIDSAERITLSADDGTAVSAFHARAVVPADTAVLILPDVRGLVPYYEELAVRFAEHGLDALAIDYFGRTAPPAGERATDFEYHGHVDATTLPGLTADVRAGAAHLRADSTRPVPRLFAVGFCFGGRLAFLATTFGLRLTGAAGIHPGLHERGALPAPVDLADRMEGPLLGLYGGADPSVPPEAVAAFSDALGRANVQHRFVTYDGAPHSFFDRKYEEFAEQSAAAWEDLLAFIRTPGPATPL
ncbi:MAG TPA: dienelactone hydrolase family protein [Clostridia bacterium]|nr:dienelactone hydrolase family protein [Clostridia bacterium]